ncbi:MAG: family 78 glycoside hydrolase catalytic domain [Planctomycetia bacterium]|nr:family 78 glycoside hydrolase catalytic domain [Planctomycetia bacterium]
MKAFLMLGLFFSFSCFSGFAINSTKATINATIEPFALTTESMVNPVGIDEMVPRLSWKSKAVDSQAYNLVQTAYQILVASSPENLAKDNGDLWDSGKIQSDCSIFIDYQGKQLQTSQRCYWKVRVWDGDDQVSNWSDSASWIMGVLKPEDWKAKWIAQPERFRPEVDLSYGAARWIVVPEDAEAAKNAEPAPKTTAVSDEDYADDAVGETKVRYFRREFEIGLTEDFFKNKKFVGFFHYAANKRFEIFVNGQKAGHSIGMIFNPDQLRTLDITEYLIPGKNVVAVQVSNDNARPTALLGEIELRFLVKQSDPNGQTASGKPDQTIESIPTDEKWFVSTSGGENWNNLDFNAEWENAVSAFDPDDGPWGKVRRRTELVSPFFQKKFAVDPLKEIATATLHITGLGFYEAFLDGEKIGDKKLDPAPTRFDKTVLYSTYDLTDSLKNSEKNDRVLDVMLGHGWFDVRSIVTWNFDAAPWRSFPQMIAQLEIVYEDGTADFIISDNSWSVMSSSPILFDCIRQGEIVQGDYHYQPYNFVAAVCVDGPKGKLKAQNFPGTVVSEEFRPKSVRETSPGVWLVDLGQNIAGWARVKIHNAEKGDVIRFRYSERILEDGSIERFDIAQHFMEGSPFYYAGEKGQFQTDFYLCNGSGSEVFEPRFTYNGFQYIEITGLKTAPTVDDFVACVVHNDFNQIGSFECSNELLNQIQNATLWSYRANYVNGYPTDCPHREKNGWTGDAHLAAEQAMFNWENSAAYEKWIDDLIDEQRTNGNLAAIVPTGGWGYPWGNGPAWDSSLILIPWYLYQYRGDVRILEKSFDAMKKYLDFMATKADNRRLVSHGLGDWVFYKTETPVVVTSSAFYYVDALIVAKIAKILGKTEDAQKYQDLAKEIQKSYNETLYQGNGVYSIGGQTTQSTPLHQGLADSFSEAERQQIFAKLVESVEKANYHFDVGIFGAKYILRTLSENGRTDLALRLVLQESQPSYADWIRRGAGTLWEDWGNGSSRNHIMFGDISAWFYQSLAGIKLPETPEQAASIQTKKLEIQNQTAQQAFDKCYTESYRPFKQFWIAPQCQLENISVPEGNLTWVNAQIDSPFGLISSSWKWNDEKTELTLKCSIPVNTSAVIVIPCNENQVIQSEKEVQWERQKDQGTTVVGSGNYEFKVVSQK